MDNEQHARRQEHLEIIKILQDKITELEHKRYTMQKELMNGWVDAGTQSQKIRAVEQEIEQTLDKLIYQQNKAKAA